MRKLMLHTRLEFLKIRRQYIWLILALVTPLLIYFAFDGHDHPTHGYMYSFYGIPLYNSIVMPLVCTTIASRICENEFDGNAFKSIVTMQKPRELFHAKFITALVFITLLCSIEPVTLLICGHVLHYADSISAFDIAYFALSQYLVCVFFIIAIQVIALYFENQLVPLSVGVIMSLLGLFSQFFPIGFMRFIPSSYFSLLNFVGMNWNASTQEMTFYRTGYQWGYSAALVAVCVALYAASLFWFDKKEN